MTLLRAAGDSYQSVQRYLDAGAAARSAAGSRRRR